MRLVIVFLVLLTMYLQYGLWYTRGGRHDVEKLQASVAEQKEEIARLKERNRSLSAEVMDLKQGLEAIEERARSEMGMIKNGEVFFRITDPNHEHDQPQTLGSAAKGVDAPLEPPLDPLAPGDAVLAGSPDTPPVAQDKPVSVKPMVKAIVNAAAAKAASGAKATGNAAAKSTPAPSRPAAGGAAKPSAGAQAASPGTSKASNATTAAARSLAPKTTGAVSAAKAAPPRTPAAAAPRPRASGTTPSPAGNKTVTTPSAVKAPARLAPAPPSRKPESFE